MTVSGSREAVSDKDVLVALGAVGETEMLAFVTELMGETGR
jgi:hypothetical protein